MPVRDATPDDVAGIASVGSIGTRAGERLIRERTVRVTVSSQDGSVSGFVSFDVDGGVVHITHLAGREEILPRLLEEPLTFAARTGATLETVIPVDEQPVITALRQAGFRKVGPGPPFEGRETRRYRRCPPDDEVEDR